MRQFHAVLLALALSSCALPDFETSPTSEAVDASSLAPLSSREQSLIYGADGAYQQGNIAAAERDYLAAVGLSTGHVEAHMALARLYEKQNKAQSARAILERALTFQPKHALANYMAGKIALDENRNDEARAYFTRGLQTQPENIDLAVGQAVADDMLGNHEKAQATYTRIMRMNPKGNVSGLRTNLAMSYLLSGAPQKAVDALKAEAKKPDVSPVTKHNLALAYGLLGKTAEATKLLEGDIDEETRLLTVARLREYIKDRAAGAHPEVPNASIAQDASPAPIPAAKPVAPVIAPKPAVVKAPVAKPLATKPAVIKPVAVNAAKPVVNSTARKPDITIPEPVTFEKPTGTP